MKAFFFILFVIAFQVTVNAWVGTIRHNPRIPLKHGGYCYTDSHNIGALNKGEEKRIQDICAVARCSENRDIYLSGCGVVGVEPPCKVVEGDLSKPYPDCCFEIKCPEDYKLNTNTYK